MKREKGTSLSSLLREGGRKKSVFLYGMRDQLQRALRLLMDQCFLSRSPSIKPNRGFHLTETVSDTVDYFNILLTGGLSFKEKNITKVGKI